MCYVTVQYIKNMSVILDSVLAVSSIPSENGVLHCLVILKLAVISNTTGSLERNVGALRDCV